VESWPDSPPALVAIVVGVAVAVAGLGPPVQSR